MSGHPMGRPDSFCSPGVSRDVYPHIRPSIRGVHRNPHCKNLHGGYSSRYTPQRSLRFNRSLSRYHDSSEPEYVRQKEMDPRKRTPRSSAPHSHWSISPRRSTTYKLDDEHNSPGRQVYASHHARLPKRHLLPDYQVTPRILPRDNLQKLHGHKRFSHWGCATKGFRYHYQHDLASERSLMNSKWVEMSSNQHGGPRHNGQLLPRDGINDVAQEREVQVPLPCLGTSDSADIYNPEEPTNETCDDGLDTSPAVQHMATHCYSMEIEQTASTQAAMEPERTWPLENEEADFFGQAGTIFPHTCSICGVRLLCDKGWTQHITGKKHKNKCWVFAMRFPKWNQKIKNHHSTRTEHEDCENVSHTQLSGSAATSEIPTSQAQPLEESLSTFPNPDRLPGPARVIHLFNLPMCNYTEGDIIRLGLPFGKVTNYILMRSKNQVKVHQSKIRPFDLQAFLEMAQPPGAQAFVEFYSSRPLHLYGYPVQVQMSSAYHHLVLKKRGRGIEAILTEDCSLHGLKEKANETRTRERSRSPLLHEQPSQHCGDRSSISSWARTDGKQHKSGPYASVVCLQSQATHSSSETKFPQCSFVVEPRDSAPKCDNALAGDHNVEERVMIEEDESNNYPDITTSSIEISNTGHEMVCQTKTYELVNGFNGDHSLSRCSGQEKEEQELLMENLEEIGTDEKDRAEKEELENNVESYVYEKERDKVQNGVKQEEGGSFMWSSNSRFLGNISPLYEDSKDADDGKKEHFIKMVVDKYSMVIVQRDDQWRSEQAETETEGGGSESAEEMKCGGEPYQNTEVVNGKQESDTVASCSEGNVDKVNDIPELKDPTPTIQCPVAPTVNMVDTDKHQKNIVLQRSSTNERISHFKLKQQISPDKGFMEASAEGSTENLLNISDKTSMRMSSLDNTTALTGVCDKCHGSGCQDLHEVALVSMEFTIPGASAREEQDEDFNKSVGAVHDCSTSLDTTKEQMFLQSDNDHQSSSGVSMTSGTSISVVKKTRTTCGPCLPIGAHFVVPKAGFYCTLCRLFYLNEEKARVRHCSSAVHYRNVEKYLVEKLSEMERCCVDEPAGAPCGDEPEPS